MQKANLSRIPFDVGRLMSAHTLKLYCNMFYEKADAKLARSIPIASQESVYIHKSATHTHKKKEGPGQCIVRYSKRGCASGSC